VFALIGGPTTAHQLLIDQPDMSASRLVPFSMTTRSPRSDA
jgi:hypothetical protein